MISALIAAAGFGLLIICAGFAFRVGWLLADGVALWIVRGARR